MSPSGATMRGAARSTRSLWIGIGLAVFGVLGLVLLPAFGPGTAAGPFLGPSATGALPRTFSSLGERIFLTGTDAQGNAIPRSTSSMYGVMFGQAGCASCHGQDGRGRTVGTMMGSFQTPDIRWSTLVSNDGTAESGKAQTPYDAVTFARAVRDGIDPEGDRLHPPMPQWRLGDAEVAALVDYLKRLKSP